MALDSSNILAAAQQFMGQTQGAQTNLLDMLGSALTESASMSQNQPSAGSRVQDGRTVYQTPLQMQTENLAAMEAQARTQEFAKQIGINPDFAADLQMQLATSLAEASRQTIEQGKKVQELQSVGLFDNPIEFLMNQVMLPDEVNKLNASQEVVKNAQGNLTAINQAVQQTAVTSNAIATRITASNMDDQLSALQAEIANKQSKLRMDNHLQAAHAIKDIWSMDQARFGIAKDIWQINRSEEAMAMQRELHALSRERENVALMKYKDEQAAMEHRLALINQAEERQYGVPKTSLQELKFNWGNNSELAKYHQKMFDVGAAMKSGVPVSAGDSILERVQFANTTPAKPGTTDQSLQLVRLQQAAVAKAMEDNKGAKPEVINAEAQKLFDKSFENMRLKVDPKDQNNPFSLLPWQAYDQASWVKSNPAYAYFRTVVKENEPADVNKFMHTLIPAIQTGKVKLDDAVQAINYIDAASRQASEVVHDIYFLTGKKVGNIQVPVQYYSTSQQVAKAAAGAGAVGTLAALGTGFGAPAALGLGAMTLGMGMYAAKPQTKLLDPSNPVMIKQAFLQMLPRQVNWSGQRMQGDGFYPSKTFVPGVDMPAGQNSQPK